MARTPFQNSNKSNKSLTKTLNIYGGCRNPWPIPPRHKTIRAKMLEIALNCTAYRAALRYSQLQQGKSLFRVNLAGTFQPSGYHTPCVLALPLGGHVAGAKHSPGSPWETGDWRAGFCQSPRARSGGRSHRAKRPQFPKRSGGQKWCAHG